MKQLQRVAFIGDLKIIRGRDARDVLTDVVQRLLAGKNGMEH